MLDFATPHTNYEPETSSRGRFVVEPLARGFGYTFGNSLRRVLLSSLEGAAISAVKIAGVEHEFSTVPHVKEDVTDIILNLKKLVFVFHTKEEDEHEVHLLMDGPAVVTAGDIQLPSTLDVIDADAVIATLEEGGRLEMQITVRKGRGYVSADENKLAETVLGVIPIDSIFSPVVRVAYSVESARVGHSNDYDKLTLEVETNGSIDPKVAVAKAAAILRDELALFVEDEIREEPEDSFADSFLASIPVEEPQQSNFHDTPIEELELGVRSYNCLKREGVDTVGDLVAKSEQELMCIPNFGRKSIEEVRDRLTNNNLKLRGE